MKLVYTGSRRAVEAVLKHGFDDTAQVDGVTGHNGSSRVALTALEGWTWMEADAAIIFEAPDDASAPFRQASQDGGGAAPRFLVPPSVVDDWPVFAHRGVSAAPSAAPRRRWMKGAAGVALLGLVGLITTLAVDGGKPPAGRSDAEPRERVGSPPPEAERAAPDRPGAERADQRVRRRPPSQAVGTPTAGQLVGGVALPAEGEHFFTWDSTRGRSPDPRYRRFGTDRTVQTVLDVVAEFRAANPGAPRVGVADLSLPRGGPFGLSYGGRGHLSHQNGLDVDVLYPLRSRREKEATAAVEIDRRLSQDLVERFVAAGAVEIFVGSATGLGGPDDIVRPRARHDTHMHIRLADG